MVRAEASTRYKSKVMAREERKEHLASTTVPVDEIANVFKDADKAVKSAIAESSDEADHSAEAEESEED